MKTVLSFLGVLILLGSLQARASSSVVDGRWGLVDRVCTDGKAAHDSFQLGRDSMVLTIADGRLQILTKVENDTETSTGVVDLGGRFFSFKMENGSEAKFIFSISNKKELLLFSAGFEDGGSCDQGQALLNVFESTDIKI